MRHTRVLGTGSYLPARVVGNDELGRRLSLDPEAIYKKTGIRTRRWASDEETASLLAERAARQAFEAAGLSPSDVDTIIVSTTSPDMVFPSTACHLQRVLGVSGTAAFDVAASCSGFLYGLSMADSMIKSGLSRRCLVAAAEVKSRFLDLDDEATAILFADGAGAAILSGEPEGASGSGSSEKPSSGLLAVRVFADGSRHDLITLPAGGSRLPASSKTLSERQHYMRIRGGPLFRVAVRRLTEAVQDLLKELGLRAGDVQRFVFHQANGRLLEAVRERLGLPADKMFSVIETFGNSSSASLPIALDLAVREGKITHGDLVLLGAFGGGLTWGTALLRW